MPCSHALLKFEVDADQYDALGRQLSGAALRFVSG
jgi:hypothetical protein